MAQPKRLHMVRPVGGKVQKSIKQPYLILCTLFLLGALLGSVFSVLGGDHPQLAQELKTYFQATAQGETPAASLWTLLWEAVCWPLLMLLFSFGPPGVLGVPCVFLVRGFLLSYACTSFVAMYGWVGIGWNAVFFGVPALILLPVLLCTGHWAFSNACKTCISRETTAMSFPSGAMLVCCGVLLAVFVVLQGHLLPALVPSLCRRLLSFTP